MKNTLALITLSLSAALLPVHASSISLSVASPVTAGSSFDVAVQVTNVFDGRAADDLLVAYGFNVTVSNGAIFQYTGETAGPLFDDISDLLGGVPMVAGFADNPAGIGPADFTEPLTLATLHFNAVGAGTSSIGVTWDSSDLNQGLIFADLPVEAISASTSVTATGSSVPEPAGFLLGGAGLVVLCWGKMRRRSMGRAGAC